MLDGMGIHFCARRNDTCRIILCHQFTSVNLHLRRINVRQLSVAFTGFLPHRQLPFKQTVCITIRHTALPILVQSATVNDFHRTKTVLIDVIAVHLFGSQRSIAVTLPTTTEIQLIIDSSNLIFTTECQAHSIVLPIGSVRHPYLSEQRSEECTWCAQSIDAQRIIMTILRSPFTMVNQSRGQRFQLEIAHSVRTNHHSAMLFIEFIHNTL